MPYECLKILPSLKFGTSRIGEDKIPFGGLRAGLAGFAPVWRCPLDPLLMNKVGSRGDKIPHWIDFEWEMSGKPTRNDECLFMPVRASYHRCGSLGMTIRELLKLGGDAADHAPSCSIR